MSSRPDGEVRVAHIQAAVRKRKPWSRDGVPDEVVDALVWETMAVLGEWEFVDLLVPNEELVAPEVSDEGEAATGAGADR